MYDPEKFDEKKEAKAKASKLKTWYIVVTED
jgi:hypothetical protein